MQKKIISFEASEDLKEALRIAAFQKSISVSALIREILEQNVCINQSNRRDNE